ncbi:MAG: RluA family pseudouridine synthase [Myxococcales bacterium]|nr:RluA family pseudouridine synthase [Myxococcales bacterium]
MRRRRAGRERRSRAIVAPPPGCAEDSVVLTFDVPREFSGVRLDRFVQWRIPRLSRSRAQAIVRACAVREDGSRRRPSDIVKFGETVILVRESFDEPEVPLDYGILLDDGAVLAIDKPAGLPMHPTASYHKHTLSYQLRERYSDGDAFVPAIAHRLDRETSGVVLCGRTREAERRLKMSFEAHRVDKTYLAIVHGELPDEGEIDAPMAAVREGLHVMMEVRRDGLEAHTRYRVRERRGGRSLVELSPRTGRQHQLRVHLASVGHPIVGDKLYGADREAPFLEYIETGMTPELEQRLGHPRQALHAHAVHFEHPETAEAMTVRAPLSPDLQALWGRAGSVA